jgi:hypothetical protein
MPLSSIVFVCVVVHTSTRTWVSNILYNEENDKEDANSTTDQLQNKFRYHVLQVIKPLTPTAIDKVESNTFCTSSHLLLSNDWQSLPLWSPVWQVPRTRHALLTSSNESRHAYRQPNTLFRILSQTARLLCSTKVWQEKQSERRYI